jgi:hypothetical protein
MPVFNKDDFRKALETLAERATLDADMEFDEHGQIVKKLGRPDRELENTIIVDEAAGPVAPDQMDLFEDEEEHAPARASKRAKPLKRAKKRRVK